MIVLNVYIEPIKGSEDDLKKAISDKWIDAMSQQPGHISSHLFKKFPDDVLESMDAKIPEYEYELVAFWLTEEQRQNWVALPIHDQVFAPVLEFSENVEWTVHNVDQEWS